MLSIEKQVIEIIHKYKNEILDEGDWWYGLPDHSINVHCLAEDWEHPDAIFSINIYKVGANGLDDYNSQYDLKPMTRREIRLA